MSNEPKGPHVIHPDAVYFADDLRRFLRFAPDTLTREKRLRGLRTARLLGRDLVLGEWLLDWIRRNALADRSAAA